jgi:hypothetical protein
MGEPVIFQRVFQLELAAQVAEEAVVPLLDGNVPADGSQVEDGHPDAGLPEPGSGADHEGALPHLAGSQHVAELPPQQAFVELAVRPPLHVRGSILAQRAAGDVETGLDRRHLPGGRPASGAGSQSQIMHTKVCILH